VSPWESLAAVNAASILESRPEEMDNAVFGAMYANRLDSLEIALANVSGHRDKLTVGPGKACLEIAARSIIKAMMYIDMQEPDKPEIMRANTHPNYWREMDEAGNDDEGDQ
jgi:hypothetical protein